MSDPIIVRYRPDVYEAIDNERLRQEQLKAAGRFLYTCADDGMKDAERLAVLMEEVGEVARAVLELSRLANDTHGKNLRKELIQVAAVVHAWLSAPGLSEGKLPAPAATQSDLPEPFA